MLDGGELALELGKEFRFGAALQHFAEKHNLILFVSGKKSSNGKALFSVCQAVNKRSYFVSDAGEIRPEWFENIDTVGICGATSTPMWLMQKVADHLLQLGAEVEEFKV